ncbi:MutS-related protein [Glaciibacter psychrotolerans]|uniref:DNA mismatch repair ATPase MutS n=1 Tax=Glaciibacter psychrotolerans TaxID=670054 RepID=A0A7Z0J761_9MICO|nr:DNA mismatch repair protein MutS [Leifsonia psychrotolerans]NYJ20584.1 DNA mismatch repair ATPase MutS [Leifsonia psychrotolerans]
MKAYLMYRDADFDLHAAVPSQAESLVQDLNLNTLVAAMAAGDAFLFDVAREALLTSCHDVESITFRQDVLRDAFAQESVVREIYDLAVEALAREKKIYSWAFTSPDSILRRSVEVLEMFVSLLRRLRRIAGEHRDAFHSAGFTRFFSMLEEELSDDYFEEIETHLKTLTFRNGVLLSSGLGQGNKAKAYVLRLPLNPNPSWLQRLRMLTHSPLTLTIADRDEAGHDALRELRGRGINLAADALAKSTDHILSFFSMLRCDLAFYIGCLNLNQRLTSLGEPLCFPVPLPAEAGPFTLNCDELYDVCLALYAGAHAVGNDITADSTPLVVITGANQGGKSTFLRSVGLAQLMLQCGMVVPAARFTASVRSGIFTHFKREEDAGMESGKLDEELSRMSDIAGAVSADGLVLFNESFASTSAREGSEIATNIVHALVNSGVAVFFVTHLYDFAHALFTEDENASLFLRADRESDRRRTFKLVKGEPLPTSFGQDVYQRIFAAAPGIDVAN